MSNTMGYNAREDSCGFGGIEMKTICLFFRQAGFVRAERRCHPRSPGGVPEAKRGAAFCAASTRAAGQELTGEAERSANPGWSKGQKGLIDRGGAKLESACPPSQRGDSSHRINAEVK